MDVLWRSLVARLITFVWQFELLERLSRGAFESFGHTRYLVPGGPFVAAPKICGIEPPLN